MKKLIIVFLLMLFAVNIYIAILSPIYLQKEQYQYNIENYVNGLSA